MSMNHISQLRAILNVDLERLRILRVVRDFGPPECWIAAGFVRSAVWDYLHQRDYSPLPADIDLIWFDKTMTSSSLDVDIEAGLHRVDSTLNWSVKNQARMHHRNGDPPYSSAIDAMKAWPETATAVAVRLVKDDLIQVAAPLGLDDLFGLIVRPTERFRIDKKQIYLDRLHSKNWLEAWPNLVIADD